MRFKETINFDDEAYGEVRGECYKECRLIATGKLPNFYNSEFHDCVIQGQFQELRNCWLWSCILNKSDFSRAVVINTITNAGSPCDAYDCTWPGIIAAFDCGWWQGLQVSASDAYLIMSMALIPISGAKAEIFKSMPEQARQRARQELKRQFRKQ